MITISQYFSDGHGGEKLHQTEHIHAAVDLLAKVGLMLDHLQWAWPADPDTGTSVSGSRGGNGDGGFRLPDSKTGAAHSMHRLAHAVDVYDPDDRLDACITDELLERFGLYREHPDSTKGWCHLQDMPPGSKRRTYYP